VLLLVGLGNPGTEYARTRHNIGFACLDVLAQRYQLSFSDKRAKALLATGTILGQRVALAKPQTFMNLSGESVVGLTQWFKIDPVDELLVIYDDLDLAFGTLRLRQRGSAGTHNGMRSIVRLLGNETFARLRVGIGAVPAGWNAANYVLARFTPDEETQLPTIYNTTITTVETILRDGWVAAMNLVNAPKPPQTTAPST
jgi:PTH1 family peptidyl-tRNA hydrolase